MRKIISIFFVLTFFQFTILNAQDAKRAKIDSLRWGFDPASAEALKRANQAKFIDSTYYVGHMIEGYHYFQRAEDHIGLRKAIKPLRKALAFFENDFDRLLRKRISKEEMYTGGWRDLFKQLDYFDVSNRLINAYITMEMPDSAFVASQKLLAKDLVFDYQSLHWMSWLHFRSRIFTSEKYGFLKNTISENMERAIVYSDSMERRFKKNSRFIQSQILGAVIPSSPFYNAMKSSFIDAPKSTLANTRGIIYGYNLNPELAASYFKQMPGEDNLAKNVNLGYTYLSGIDLREAERYFNDVPDLGSRSRGGHWQGYSIVYANKGAAYEGALKLKTERDSHGYSIGYGWDNLCLARLFLYSGNLVEAEEALKRAEDFNEVHYNTSFREDQYQFMLNTLNLILHESKINAKKFENKNHWFAMDWWKSFPVLSLTKYRSLYQLANEMAENPEREMVYYRVFHTESIISFDETWQIIHNYSQDYFQQTYKKLAATDPRRETPRYYKFINAMLLNERGNPETAMDELTAVLNSGDIDMQYEKLLVGRIHEAAAKIAYDKGWLPQLNYHLNQLYQFYPQLIPFSGLRMTFEVKTDVSLDNNGLYQNLYNSLNNFNLNLIEETEENWPVITFRLAENENLQYQIEVNREVYTQGFVAIESETSATKLAYELFKIYNKK